MRDIKGGAGTVGCWGRPIYLPWVTVTTTSHGPVLRICRTKNIPRCPVILHRLCSSFDVTQKPFCFVSLATFRLREKYSLSDSEAAKRAREELQDEEEKAQADTVSIWDI